MLGFDGHAVLGEDAFCEAPDERPGQVKSAGNPGLFDHEEAAGVTGALFGVLGHVRGPEAEGRAFGSLRYQVECLVRAFGADGHDVGGVPAADAFGGQEAGAVIPFPAGVGEQVPGLYRSRIGP
ncbi:hypothetical protein H4N64_24810 [Streptomyces sp. PSKA01]|uniref:Uncharacterized protein n=1 Tax=Streptomyces cupreus TaxID=2759956 RepID=A0A7X1J607_9ACTN|nr:hypothetical protein [Streptomyces cupreus]